MAPSEPLLGQNPEQAASGRGPLMPPLPPAAAALLNADPSDRDMRRRRPALLSLLLRWETLRRLARVASLLVLDFAGVFLAIYTALAIKALVRGKFGFDLTLRETKDIVAFAYLLTALLFARSSLYADRGERPGLTRIVASLFQVAFVALVFSVVNGEHFSSYYIFYGSLLFALIYLSSLRFAYERLTGLLLRAAGYQRRAVLVGTGQHIEAVAHALGDDPNSPVDVVGFISLRPRPDNGLRSLGTIDELGSIIADHAVDEVIIADPDFPRCARSSWSTSATGAGSGSASPRPRWRS